MLLNFNKQTEAEAVAANDDFGGLVDAPENALVSRMKQLTPEEMCYEESGKGKGKANALCLARACYYVAYAGPCPAR